MQIGQPSTSIFIKVAKKVLKINVFKFFSASGGASSPVSMTDTKGDDTEMLVESGVEPDKSPDKKSNKSNKLEQSSEGPLSKKDVTESNEKDLEMFETSSDSCKEPPRKKVALESEDTNKPEAAGSKSANNNYCTDSGLSSGSGDPQRLDKEGTTHKEKKMMKVDKSSLNSRKNKSSFENSNR